MLATALVVLAPSIMPGWALSSVLDGSGDRFRKALLAPALGLLLLFGVSGLLVVLDLWSPVLLAVVLAGLGAVVVAHKVGARQVERPNLAAVPLLGRRAVVGAGDGREPRVGRQPDVVVRIVELAFAAAARLQHADAPPHASR